jgi:hypothetical protein
MKLKKKPNKLLFIFILGLFFLIPFLFSPNINTPYRDKVYKIHSSSEEYYSEQWLTNPTFENPNESWYCTTQGDTTDINGSLVNGRADFNILGEQHTFSVIADPPLALDWSEVDNPEFPNHPDVDEITSDGCKVSHEFDDQTAVQNPSVHWDRNVTVPVNMMDYEITSASVQSIVNATVDENLDRYTDYYYGYLARNDPNEIVDTFGVGDYVRFYVLLSDLEKNKVYEIAYFQTANIGIGSPPGTDVLSNTDMTTVSEEVLQFYLSSVLNSDNHNFTISLGIRLNIEDNVDDYYDLDTFNELIINYLNLTFTYKKKIDQLTTISWNQIGDSIDGNNVKLDDATLNFKYKINQIWSQELSLNSELRIVINNYDLEKTIKLSSMNTSFQEIDLGKIDVLDYILTNINISISIQVFIADEFVLDDRVTISIDDVYLTISYVETFPDPPPSNDNDFLWIILIIASITIGILGSLSVRSYVIVPRNQRRKSYLMLRTQKFKDIRNMQAFIAMHKPSGLPIYSQSYSQMMKGKKTLFSGFIQAVSIIGEEMTRSDKKEGKMKRDKHKVDFHKVVELDLKQFHCLVLDVEDLRTVLILKSKSSKRLKELLLHFSFALYVKISQNLQNWDNDINGLDDVITPLIYEYFDIYYKDPFSVNIQESELPKYRKKLGLSKSEIHLLNLIFSILKEKSNFKLMDIIERETTNNEDDDISALESLIEAKLIKPIK